MKNEKKIPFRHKQTEAVAWASSYVCSSELVKALQTPHTSHSKQKSSYASWQRCFLCSLLDATRFTAYYLDIEKLIIFTHDSIFHAVIGFMEISRLIWSSCIHILCVYVSYVVCRLCVLSCLCFRESHLMRANEQRRFMLIMCISKLYFNWSDFRSNVISYNDHELCSSYKTTVKYRLNTHHQQ